MSTKQIWLTWFIIFSTATFAVWLLNKYCVWLEDQSGKKLKKWQVSFIYVWNNSVDHYQPMFWGAILSAITFCGASISYTSSSDAERVITAYTTTEKGVVTKVTKHPNKSREMVTFDNSFGFSNPAVIFQGPVSKVTEVGGGIFHICLNEIKNQGTTCGVANKNYDLGQNIYIRYTSMVIRGS